MKISKLIGACGAAIVVLTANLYAGGITTTPMYDTSNKPVIDGIATYGSITISPNSDGGDPDVVFTVTTYNDLSLTVSGTFPNASPTNDFDGPFLIESSGTTGATASRTVTYGRAAAGLANLATLTITTGDSSGHGSTNCLSSTGWPNLAKHYPVASLGFGNDFLSSVFLGATGWISNLTSLGSSLSGPRTFSGASKKKVTFVVLIPKQKKLQNNQVVK